MKKKNNSSGMIIGGITLLIMQSKIYNAMKAVNRVQEVMMKKIYIQLKLKRSKKTKKNMKHSIINRKKKTNKT